MNPAEEYHIKQPNHQRQHTNDQLVWDVAAGEWVWQPKTSTNVPASPRLANRIFKINH